LRSELGYTDHHCAEALLSTTALMWMVQALDPERSPQQRVRLSAASGVSFGCYLLTWGGGSLFVLVVVASAAASLIVQRFHRESTESLPTILAPAFIVAALMMCAVGWQTRPYFAYDLAALLGGLAGLFVLKAWGAASFSRRHGLLMYVAGLAACAALGLAVTWIRQGRLERTRPRDQTHLTLAAGRLRARGHAAPEIDSAVPCAAVERVRLVRLPSRCWAASGICGDPERSRRLEDSCCWCGPASRSRRRSVRCGSLITLA
jgi:hypothetical protein